MENKKKELLSIAEKLNRLDAAEIEYIKGWLDAKLDIEKEVS